MPCVIYTYLLWFAAGFTPCRQVIFIRPEYKDDNALLQHELTHVEQMHKLGTLRFWLLYATKSGRLALELEAYRVQITYGASLIAAAEVLSSRYFLGITKQQALDYLTGVTNG